MNLTSVYVRRSSVAAKMSKIAGIEGLMRMVRVKILEMKLRVMLLRTG